MLPTFPAGQVWLVSHRAVLTSHSCRQVQGSFSEVQTVVCVYSESGISDLLWVQYKCSTCFTWEKWNTWISTRSRLRHMVTGQPHILGCAVLSFEGGGRVYQARERSREYPCLHGERVGWCRVIPQSARTTWLKFIIKWGEWSKTYNEGRDRTWDPSGIALAAGTLEFSDFPSTNVIVI